MSLHRDSSGWDQETWSSLIDCEDVERESLVVVVVFVVVFSRLCTYAIGSIYTIESSLLRDPLFLSFARLLRSPGSRSLSDDLSLALFCVAIAIVAYRLGTSTRHKCYM